MPQLVYEAGEPSVQGAPEPWNEVVRDAGSVEWKKVLRLAAALAIPTGILSNALGFLGALLMAMAAAWVVLLYMRNRHPAWITVGAGARIGLVTGLLGGWASVATAGITLFAMRFWMHQGKVFDDLWTSLAGQQVPQQLAAAGWDAQMVAIQKARMMTPGGQAGWTIGILLFLSASLLLFGVAGGAIGARLLVRTQRSQL
jgi:hypothetical protein